MPGGTRLRPERVSSAGAGTRWRSPPACCTVQAVITVLLRYEHHIDHTFLQATHYRDQGGVLTVHRGEEEVARFSAGSWDGVYRSAGTRVREADGGERTAKGLEVELGEDSGSTI